MKFSMIEQEKGDLLIQVTANMISGGSFDCIPIRRYITIWTDKSTPVKH